MANQPPKNQSGSSASDERPFGPGSRISTCILVNHEQSGLKRAIESVASISCEIIVVSTRTSPEITELARQAGARLVEKRWRSSFSAVRNAGIDAATGDWILSLSADEWLEPSSIKAIRRATEQRTFDGWLVCVRNLLEPSTEGECFLRRECRLFRRQPAVRFERTICETVEPSIVQAGGEVAMLTGADITNGACLVRPEMREWESGLRVHLLSRELKNHPNDPELLLGLGFEHYSSGDFVRAEQALDQARRHVDRASPSAGLIYSLLIVSLRETANTDRGLAISLEAASAGINSPEIEFATAWTHMARREHPEAIRRFQKALDSSRNRGPESPGIARSSDPTISQYRASMGIALAMVEAGQISAALPHAEDAVKGCRSRPEPYVLLGCVHHLLGDCARAQKSLEKALEMNPAHSDALSLILPVYHDTKQYDRALQSLDKMIAVRGCRPELLVRRAAVLTDMGKLPEAADQASEAVAMAPDEPDVQMDAGKVFAACGKNTEALRCFEEAIRLEPMHPYPFFGAGDLLYKLGAYSEAMEAYSHALERDPGNATGFFALGNACIKCGYLEPAIRNWERAIELKPDHTGAQTNLRIARQTLSRAA